ncbi:50S ribosomal protein L18e [Candidatus Woesearchaeota archaeon]|nr:MAG: 50S ribosomal protein L18e [Candidatus Woesearchaeota archaeon]
MHITKKTNTERARLIQELKKHARETKAKLWQRVAQDLERPTRKTRIVNLYKINRYAKDGETVLVPGKVLGTGELNRSVHVAAFAFSEEAKRKISAGGRALTVEELMKENPKGQKVRILG